MVKKKTKFLYATKLQYYIMLVTDVFMAAMFGYIAIFESEPVPIFIYALMFVMMGALTWAIYQSYKGKFPLLRIEE